MTFTSSSDDSDQASKKRKLTNNRIPDTQTMVQQLQKLDLSPSQMENGLKANRNGRHRLSLKRKACDTVGHSSYREINTSSKNDFIDSDKDSTNDTLLALQLLKEELNSESQLHTAASLQETERKLNPAASHESGDVWETIHLTDSQVKNLENLEEATTSVVKPLVKEEPQSDEDIQFMGEFVSGSYEGPHTLVKLIKQEFISPSDLEAYNKNAIGDKDKLVLVQENISNGYDVWKVYSKEQLEELLKGVH